MVLKSALSGSHIQASGFAGGAMTAFFKGFLKSVTFPGTVDHMRFVSYSIE